jgi:peroxiredoxin
MHALRSPIARLAALAGLALALSSGPARAQLAIGDAVPMTDVKMAGVDGKSVTLASVAGKKGTLVVFTCNHCPWAKMWQTRVTEIGNAAGKAGIGMVAINANDPADYPEDDINGMKQRAKELKIKFPYVIDATSDVARAFGATRTPEAFLFDAEGKLVYHGTVDDSPKDASGVKDAWLKDAVNAVSTGKTVTTAETKAMGCSIKFRAKTTS